MADWFASSVKWTAVTPWAALTAYSVGDIRRQLATPTVGEERVFRCTTAGVSGTTEPAPWTLTKGGTTTDATVVWTEVTGNSAYNTLGGSFLAPHARLRKLADWMAAGDRGIVLNDHAATEAAAVTVTLPGTFTSPCQILGVNSSGALATGASDANTGANNYTINGYGYVYGMTVSAASGAGASSLLLCQAAQNRITFDNCDLVIPQTNSGARIVVGSTAQGIRATAEVLNSRLGFGHVGQVITAGSKTLLRNVSLRGGSSVPTGFAEVNALNASDLLVEASDLSGWASTVTLLSTGSNSNGRARFRNCKVPASWSLMTGTPEPGFRAEAWNLDSGDTNYMLRVGEMNGTIREETTLVKTGGASDGDTPLAWKLVTSADAEYPLNVLRSPEIFSERITSVGSAKTITVDILHDSVTALNDDEVWLEVQYLGTSGVPLALFANDGKANVLASAAAQAASSATWTTTGMSNPNKQKLEVSFTPQEEGRVLVTICMAKASYTAYVCPKTVIT